MLVYRLISPEEKSYIGFTEKTLKRRLTQHKNDAKKLDYDLHRAIRKYPIDQWKVEILEECNSREDLENRERYYIKKFDSYKNGYNMTLGGDGLDPETASKARKEYFKTKRGKEWKKVLSKKWSENNPGDWTGKRHSEESKKKISRANSGRTKTEKQKKAHSNEMKNRWEQGVYADRPNPTPESNAKRSKKLMGHPAYEKQRKKASEANQKQWIVTDPNGNEFDVTNLRQFCLSNDLNPDNIARKSGSRGWKAKKKGD